MRIEMTVTGKGAVGASVAGKQSAQLGIERPSGTANYAALVNKPSIEGVTLVDNKTFKELGMEAATVAEIERILYLD